MYRAEGIIFMVLECGEIDLARLLQKREAARKEHDGGAASLDENFIRLYWEQMLRVRIGKRGVGVLRIKPRQRSQGSGAALGCRGVSVVRWCSPGRPTPGHSPLQALPHRYLPPHVPLIHHLHHPRLCTRFMRSA